MKKNNTKTIILLDTHAIMHRAYHALPQFTNSAGVHTGALYGLSTMILKLIQTFSPTLIVAAYDLPKPTFRHTAYDHYKAGRAKTDDALISQLQRAKDIYNAFGIPLLAIEGYEADDILGVLSVEYTKDPDVRIIIASGDMDTLQLVRGEKVQVYTLKKGVTDTILYGEKEVRDRFGFSPELLPDYKGLRGDPSDNIIGVKGVGEKTATTLINVYGNLEKIYEALERQGEDMKKHGITPRIKELLLTHKDEAFFSRDLATIQTNIPLSLEEKNFSYTPHPEKIISLFRELEFRSLITKIETIFAISSDVGKEVLDPEKEYRASIALWMIRSDITTPSYNDIVSYTKKTSLDESIKVLEQELVSRDIWWLYNEVEIPLISITRRMKERGICIDCAHFKTVQKKYSKKVGELEKRAHVLVGQEINLNSPKQLSALLFETLGLAPKGKRKVSGSFSTNAETLESLKGEHEIIDIILEYREVQKILSTYIEPLLLYGKEDGVIHADFFQHGTSTGRFSSANPNLQNLPAQGEASHDIRKGFVARDGYVFLSCDYSQIELRVLALLSKDSGMCDAFMKGEDIHTSVAMHTFGVAKEEVTSDMRRKAKIINFGIIYGMGVGALQKNLGTTRAEAQFFYTQYFETFPDIAGYFKKVVADAKSNGFVETLFKRRRLLPTIHSPIPFIRANAERMAMNAPIQGTAADIMKIAIVAVQKKIEECGYSDKAFILLHIHDELVFEIKSEFVCEVRQLILKTLEQVLAPYYDMYDIPYIPLRASAVVGGTLDELK
jgi:DNA polymerase-1